jgi:hypothetical protein
MKKVFLVLAALSLALAFSGVSRVEASTASFSVITLSFTGNSYTVPQSFGYVFTPNTHIDVTSLGFFDYYGTGLVESHEVGIFNSSGTLLASATIPAGTIAPLEDRFRYIGITPLGLSAGQTYTAAAYVTSTLDTVGYTTVSGVSVNPDISLPSFAARYIFASGLQLPTQTSGASSTMYVGPNFQLVPLPPSVWLLGSGLLGLAVGRRFRKS